jgi:hypothetical protein
LLYFNYFLNYQTMLDDFRARGIYLTEDAYQTGLRALFPENYQPLTDEELEDILYERIAQMSPAEAEGFFSSIGNFIKDKVAPVAVAALPAVATVAGTAIGGPVGSAIGGVAGKFAADTISKYANVTPNQGVANVGQAVTSVAGGNYQAAIPSVINLGKSIGVAIPGTNNQAGNLPTPARAVPTVSNQVPMPTATNGQVAGGAHPPAGATDQPPTQAASQLLSFLNSTPLLQALLSSIATGNLNTGLQLLKEDGSSTNTSYVEMLEALKQLTENAIAEADNLGITAMLPTESEADNDEHIESLIESVNNYENALLPNYDSITY